MKGFKETQLSKPKRTLANETKGRLFFLEASVGRILYDGLPEPIDLELDRKNRLIYWADHGDPPGGNAVNRAPMDADSKKRREPDILLTHLIEGIGDRYRLQGRLDVSRRFGRLDLFRQARRDRKETTARRAGKSHRHRLRRN